MQEEYEEKIEQAKNIHPLILIFSHVGRRNVNVLMKMMMNI
jgi:hypothetical protein